MDFNLDCNLGTLKFDNVMLAHVMPPRIDLVNQLWRYRGLGLSMASVSVMPSSWLHLYFFAIVMGAMRPWSGSAWCAETASHGSC